jgi:hypothetical protein
MRIADERSSSAREPEPEPEPEPTKSNTYRDCWYLKGALRTFAPRGRRCPARGESRGLLGLTRIVLQEFFKGVERLLGEPFARIVPGDDLEGVFVFS